MKWRFCLLLCLLIPASWNMAYSSDAKLIVGWIEKISILPENLVLHAKMDTGADNSSISASGLTLFTNDGEKWVRFTVTDKQGQAVNLERKIVRMVRIRRHLPSGETGPLDRVMENFKGKRTKSLIRPVVIMGFCVGNVYKEVEVNLADRSRFKYEVLIGRSFMRDSLIVDPSLTFVVDPKCKEASKH